MMLGPAIEVWLAMFASCVAMFCMAIFAGRSQHIWQVFPLLALEMVLMGAAFVLWMFEVWFVAKILMAIGMSASTALLLGIAIGIVLVVSAVAASLLLLRTGYVVFGMRARYASDFANSLWLGRLGPWRPGKPWA
jgi:hypothetical protein